MNEIVQRLLEIPEENQTIEFKRLKGNEVVKKIIKTIVAFANTDGGQIIIGVDDPEKTRLKGLKRVYGIEESKELFDEITREVQRISPPVGHVNAPILIKVAEINKTIAIIRVPKAATSFHSIDNNVYVRLHKGNKKLSPSEVVKFSYAKGFEKADKELVDVDFELLDTMQYEAWRRRRSIDGNSTEEVLFKTGLARRDENGNIKPTRAAVLLFAEYPTNLMDTKCAVRVMQYTGRLEVYKEAPNMVGVPQTVEGPLVELIKKTHEYVLTILRTGIEIHSGFITKYQIPERTIKEAITNAIIHRDYHIKRDIEIKIFEDRVEVISPGLFPYNITVSNIGHVRSDGYRNDLLVKHMREFPNPPNLDQNEGVQAMRNEMLGSGLFPPIYITYPEHLDSVEVTLLNEHRPDEWEKVRAYLQANRYIANEKAREITGVEQRDKMSRLLNKWVRQGLLIRIQPKAGGAKGTKYKLANTEELENGKR